MLSINKKEAMNIAAVAKCVNLISETVAMIPIKLYSEEFIDGKRKTNEIEDPRCDLLNYDTLDTFHITSGSISGSTVNGSDVLIRLLFQR